MDLIKKGRIVIQTSEIILSNERLILREFNYDDWVDVHRYASQDIVSRYQTWGPNTEKETKHFIAMAMKDATRNPRIRFVLAIVPVGSERVIGAGELSIRDDTNRSGEIAFIVHPDYWGKGIATCVADLLIDFGIKSCRLHRIFATCAPENIGSYKVLEKAGMIHEGIIREHLLLKDGWRDSLLYSTLDHEWKRAGDEKCQND